MPRVILASASPRRRELLAQLIPEFEIIPSNLSEFELEDPHETAQALALAKASAVARQNPDAWVIGADTVVAYRDETWHQLAKPTDARNACRILGLLSGRDHIVITGLAVVGPSWEESKTDSTRVRFRSLSNAEIAAYVATGEPMDKAGAYAIQGGARAFVESVDGSESNVIGLPLELLSHMLAKTSLSRA